MTASDIDLIAAIVSIAVVTPLVLKGGLACNMFLIASALRRRSAVAYGAREHVAGNKSALDAPLESA